MLGFSLLVSLKDLTNPRTVDSDKPYFLAVGRAPREIASLATEQRNSGLCLLYADLKQEHYKCDLITN